MPFGKECGQILQPRRRTTTAIGNLLEYGSHQMSSLRFQVLVAKERFINASMCHVTSGTSKYIESLQVKRIILDEGG